MNGNKKILLDTNVLIFASKQQLKWQELLADYDAFYVSVISYMEVFGYSFKNLEEKKLLENLFSHLHITHLDSKIAEEVIHIRRNAPRKIKLPDAVILATSRTLNIPLLTDDWDDFLGISENAQILNIEKYRK